MSNRSKPALYSITSSAVASSVSGTVRPSALAVLRLITNSNASAVRLGDRPDRRPSQFWQRTMRRVDIVCQGLPIRDETSHICKFSKSKYCRKPVLQREFRKLLFIKDHERVGEYNDALPMVVDHCGKSFINPAR